MSRGPFHRNGTNVGWAHPVEADPRRVYIYISVYICLPCHSSLRRCVFTPASSFCPSPKLPGIRTGPVLAHARARLLTAAVHDGVSEAPLSRKAHLQTPLSRTGREGLKFVMTHLGQITTRVASSSRYTPPISSVPANPLYNTSLLSLRNC